MRGRINRTKGKRTKRMTHTCHNRGERSQTTTKPINSRGRHWLDIDWFGGYSINWNQAKDL